MTDLESTEAEELDPPIIIYHADCPDGFSAMTILNHCLGGSCEIVPGRYGEDPPEVTGRHVWIVDFSYDRDTMEKLWVIAESISMLDHHLTALEAIDWSIGSLDEAVTAAVAGEDFIWLDMEQSGVGMVARFCERVFGFEPPDWVWNVEDRDLWRFELDGTAEVFAALTSYPHEYGLWEGLLSATKEDLRREGVSISRYREQLIETTLATAFRAVIPTGHEVWVAASPYAIGSDVAGRLAKQSDEGWAAYFVTYGNRVRYGLRSRGDVDVEAIAKALGGGGHKSASGFESDLGPSPI